MKLLPILCAALLASGILAVFADNAGSGTINTSKSNTFRLDTSDPNAEKKCTDGGGAVSTDKDGNKICTMPEAANATTVKGSKSNSSD